MSNFGRGPEGLYGGEASTSHPESHIPVAQQVEELKQEVEKEKSLLETLEDLVYRIPGKDLQWRKDFMEEFSQQSDLVLRTTTEKIKEKYGNTLLTTPASKEPAESVVYEESDSSGDASIGGSELAGDQDPLKPIDLQQTPVSYDIGVPTKRPIPPIDPEQNPTTDMYPTKKPEIQGPTLEKKPEVTPPVPTQEATEIQTPDVAHSQDVPDKTPVTSQVSTEPVSETKKKVIEEGQSNPLESPKAFEHTVVTGQSLWRIVQAYFPDIESSDAINEKIDQIVKDNDIKNRDNLEIGQKLKISGVAPVQEAQSEDVLFAKYRVQRGDTLWKIVQLHFPQLKGTDEIHAMIDKIATKNSIRNKDQISIGQTLQIPMGKI